MNGPEKKVVYLSLCLLVLGVVVRFLPWGLPSIESFQVGDRVIVANEPLAFPAVDSLKMSADYEVETYNPKPTNTDKLKDAAEKKSKKSSPKVLLPVHVNSAGLEELCALKGVGPKLAEKILAYRSASGPFKNEKDLQKVPGIGKKKLEGILPGVIFD